MFIGLAIFIGDTGTAGDPSISKLLLESGDDLLQEDGSLIVI